MNQYELQINKIAQGLVELQDGIDWFESSDLQSQKEINRSLGYFLLQAHPTRNEIDEGIASSGLKSTYTPCVLMAKKPLKDALYKILNLPENEWQKTFILMITIFSIADKRRRETNCSNGCAHEWHNIEKL